MEQYPFQVVSARSLVLKFHWNAYGKATFLKIRLVSQRNKTNLLVNKVISWEVLKQKCFHRNSCSKGFSRVWVHVNSGVHLQKSCKSQIFNFTKDRLCLLVPMGIYKIFRTAILWTSAANYFYYYIVPRFFIGDKSF